MGLHISEIEPLGSLSREQTLALAKRLKSAAEDCVRGGIPAYEIKAAAGACRGHNISIAMLEAAEWLTPHFFSGYSLTEKACKIANATIGLRMTFNEACGEILALRQRLREAPPEMQMPMERNSTAINRIALFGSAARDVNERTEIGDLDLCVDFGRRDELPIVYFDGAEREWKNVVTNGDDRVHMHDMWDIIKLSRNPPDNRPFCLVQIWENPRPLIDGGTNGQRLWQEYRDWTCEMEQRTLSTEDRARRIAQMVARDL